MRLYRDRTRINKHAPLCYRLQIWAIFGQFQRLFDINPQKPPKWTETALCARLYFNFLSIEPATILAENFETSSEIARVSVQNRGCRLVVPPVPKKKREDNLKKQTRKLVVLFTEERLHCNLGCLQRSQDVKS